MQVLKAKKEEEKRIESVQRVVIQLYTLAVQTAQTSTVTSYSFIIMNSEYKFYKDNIEDILSGLQTLFPGCAIKFVNMCMGYDGKRYDVSTIDEKMLPFINQAKTFECILIDWS